MRTGLVRVLRLLIAVAMMAAAMPAFAEKGGLRRSPNAIKDDYIVVFRDDLPRDRVPGLAQALAAHYGGRLQNVWQDALKGFAVEMPEARALALGRHPDVLYVEENAEMFYSATHPTNFDPSTCDPNTTPSCANASTSRLWHLDLLDQDSITMNNTYTTCHDGTGVTVYVVDSGVAASHSEFAGTNRVTAGHDASGDPPDFPANNPCRGFATTWDDPNGLNAGPYNNQLLKAGHGTAVASILGGQKSGVARGATIVPVKVSRCEGLTRRVIRRSHPYNLGDIVIATDPRNNGDIGLYKCTTAGTSAATAPSAGAWGATAIDGTSGWAAYTLPPEQTVRMIINGLDWIASSGNSGPKAGAVVTMSTYRTVDQTDVVTSTQSGQNSMEQAVAALSNLGLVIVASANNQGGDACVTSPARLSRTNPTVSLRNKVITVGGLMETNGAVSRWVAASGDSTPPSAGSAPTLPGGEAQHDRYTAGSNGGACVTLFAPAKDLFVAGIAGSSSYRTPGVSGTLASGTSWSAPFVAGVVARRIDANTSSTPYTPDEVHDFLINTWSRTTRISTATLNPSGVTDTPNRVVYAGNVAISSHPADQSFGSTAPQLNVTASILDSVTPAYQWYEIASTGYDATTRRLNGQATPVLKSGATGSSFTPKPAPTAATAYFVRVTGSCGVADSNVALATPVTISAPTGLSVGRGTSQMEAQWSAVSGADGYRIEQKVPGVGWALCATVTGGSTTWATFAPPSASVALYRVVATQNGAYSSPSGVDVAASSVLTPVTTTTVISAAHVIELRQLVNALCAADGDAAQFASNEVDTAALNALTGTAVTTTPYTTLLSRLNTARTNAGLSTTVSWTHTPASGQPIRTTAIEDLRNGLR